MVHVQGAGWQAGKEAYNCALLYCPQQAVRAMDPRRFCQLRTPSEFRDRARITVCLSHTHTCTRCCGWCKIPFIFVGVTKENELKMA